MKNKQIPFGLARPGHLVGLSVDDWVAQSCSVWGLGWSHNCFLWAAQPPEPLHNWLSGWYSPPPSFLHIPQTVMPSSSPFVKTSSLPQHSKALVPYPFSQFQSFPQRPWVDKLNMVLNLHVLYFRLLYLVFTCFSLHSFPHTNCNV